VSLQVLRHDFYLLSVGVTDTMIAASENATAIRREKLRVGCLANVAQGSRENYKSNYIFSTFSLGQCELNSRTCDGPA
jgi:hypothetical protein